MFTLEGQLDHIFYDAHLEPVAAYVLERGRSDHLPVVATFTRVEPARPGAEL